MCLGTIYHICLTFTKVIDRVTLGTDEEEQYEVTDRSYWEKRSTPQILKSMDETFECLKELIPNYELKYNKFYILTMHYFLYLNMLNLLN